jgi:hypothetical protein
VNSALTPLSNMGQQLFEPPDVNGWSSARAGSTGAMLARMNSRRRSRRTRNSTCATPRDAARTAQGLLSTCSIATLAPLSGLPYTRCSTTCCTARGQVMQVANKAAGLAHLIAATGYQLV